MRFFWLTDIHLNFLKTEKRVDFYKKVTSMPSDSLLISGDIAEAPSIAPILEEMIHIIQKPIYFILGNHDYYHSSIDTVRKIMVKLTSKEPFLFWLPASGPQKLSNDVILLGQDCFADGRYGNYANSHVVLNDSRMIVDLFQSRILGKYPLLEKMQQLADRDANELKKNIKKVMQAHHPRKILILVHVPPFIEVCMHEGRISNNDYLPFFSSKVTGDVLRQAAQNYPEVTFLVLCGHTHSEGFFQPLENLTIKAGTAEYGYPIIQELIEL